VENLIELSKGFNADQQTAMIEIYSLYSDQKFDEMYNKYLEYNQFGSDFFFKVFPELTFANVRSEGVVEMNNTLTREKVLEEIQPLAKAA